MISIIRVWIIAVNTVTWVSKQSFVRSPLHADKFNGLMQPISLVCFKTVDNRNNVANDDCMLILTY